MVMSKISLISRVLDHFYPAPPIPLNHFDNFTLLVSVVLSAQTTDGKVNEVTKKLFEVAPTPQLMCAMDASEIQRIIQPVGLAPKKSVYLKKLSQKIVDDFNGDVPSTFENLESLAGVGHKTASVVMSQVLCNDPTFPINLSVALFYLLILQTFFIRLSVNQLLLSIHMCIVYLYDGDYLTIRRMWTKSKLICINSFHRNTGTKCICR